MPTAHRSRARRWRRGPGRAIALDVIGLPSAGPGTFYQAWLKSVDGDLMAIGTFHQQGGATTIQLWAGVSADRYPTLTVTVQHEGAGPASSGQVVLRGGLWERR